MTVVIPEELVPLLRDGLYFDLHGQLEEAGSLGSNPAVARTSAMGSPAV